MFDEKLHPRHEAGNSHGGEFAPKSAQGSTAPEWQQKGFQSREDWVKAKMRESLAQMRATQPQQPMKPVQDVNISAFDVGKLPMPKQLRIDTTAVNEWYADDIAALAAQGFTPSQIADRILAADEAINTIANEKDLRKFNTAIESHFDKVLEKHNPSEDGYLIIDGANWEDFQADYVQQIASVMYRQPLEDFIESVLPTIGSQEEPDTYSIAKDAIDRYLTERGVPVERYGLGGAAMKAIVGLLAMHAMSSMTEGADTPRQQSAAQPQGPSNQPFEKLHPRQTNMSGKYKPGQFAPKNQGQSAPAAKPQQAQSKPVRPLTEPSGQTAFNPNSPPPKPAVQPPEDTQTAAIAAKWEWNQPAQRNYPDNLNKPPEQQELYQPREATVQALTDEVYTNYVKTAGNPQRKKLLTDGTPNPDYVGGNVLTKAQPDLLDQDYSGGKITSDSTTRPKAVSGNNTAFRQTRAYGRNGTISFESADHMEIHDLGSMWLKGSNRMSDRQQSDHLRQAQEKTAALAQKHGLNEHEMKFHAIDTAKATSKQAKGMSFGDNRKVSYTPFRKKESSLLDPTGSSGGGDIFNNPAAKARAEKAELDRVTAFDPASFATPEQPDAPQQVGTVADYAGDFTALDAARKQRSKQLEANRDWLAETVNNPDNNIADIASEHEYDHEPFSQYIKEIEQHEQGNWKRRESMKTAIRKAWGVHGGDLARMENKGRDHSTLIGSDELRGNVPEADLYEFLGSDDSQWPQNAWELLREDPQPKPGAHDAEWVRSHAARFGAYAPQQDYAGYPEPQDGDPFSRTKLVEWIDRYFKQHQVGFRKRQIAAEFWTPLDVYL